MTTKPGAAAVEVKPVVPNPDAVVKDAKVGLDSSKVSATDHKPNTAVAKSRAERVGESIDADELKMKRVTIPPNKPGNQMYFKYQPTIKGVDGFNDSVAEKAGLEFRRGIQGGLQDGNAVNDFVNILGRHDNLQRSRIDQLYKTQFGKSMAAELTAELRGDAKDLALALISDPAVYDAKCVKTAISDLETEVIEDTSGRFEFFLDALLNANRDESPWEVEVENPEQRTEKVNADVDELFTASRDRYLGGDTFSSFNRILCLRSFYHLREVFTAYEKKYGVTLESVIQQATTDHLRDGCLAIYKLATTPEDFFEEILYKSILNQDEKTFMRVLVSRSERDLDLILNKLKEKRGKSIVDFIAAKNSASYRQLLLAVIGAHNASFR